MKFMEALELLKQQKMLVRESWKEEDGYLVLLPGMNHIWKIIPPPKTNAGNHILSVEELYADDWKVYQSIV